MLPFTITSSSSSKSRRKNDSNNKKKRSKKSSTATATALSLLSLSSTLINRVNGDTIYPTENTHSAGIGAPHQLYTSSAAYCSPPLALLVTALDLKFFPGNNTLQFDLAAASIDPDLNATIALSVNAYGLGLFNVQLDLCQIGGGLLCPLPTYEFNGGGIFPIPKDLASGIPTIAFTIPDLEAVATLEVTNQATNEVVGCVQATLSNGHTTHQIAAIWATVGLALLAAFSSILHSCIAQSTGAAQWRIIDVMMSLQHVALASFLSLTYPIAFLSYALNFGWSVGMIDIPSLQNSITKTRRNTGGTNTATFGSDLTAQVGRKYDPFSSSTPSTPATSGLGGLGGLGGISLISKVNDGSSSNQLQSNIQSSFTRLSPLPGTGYFHDLSSGLVKRQMYAPNTGPDGHLIQSDSSSQIHTITQNATSSEGLAMFAERLYIAPDNAFLTVLVSGLIFLGMMLVILFLVYLLASTLKSIKKDKEHGWAHRFSTKKEFFGNILPVFMGRFYLITFPIFLIFAFYQWKNGDSWVPDLVAAIFLVFFLVGGLVLFWPMIRHVRKNESVIGTKSARQELYYDEKGGIPPAHESLLVKRDGAMAHPYRPKYYWFALVFLVASVIRACFISFAQGHGFIQSVGLLVLEFIFTIVLCVLRVGRDKKSDFVFIILSITRMLSWAVCIAFTERANVTTIPRVIVGFVLLVVTGLPIIFLFVVTVLDLISPFRKSKLKPVKRDGEGNVVGEKNVGDGNGNGEDYQYGQVATTNNNQNENHNRTSPNEDESQQHLGANTERSSSDVVGDGQPKVF